MSSNSEKTIINLKSGSGRILRTDALDMQDMIAIEVRHPPILYPVIESVIRASSELFDSTRRRPIEPDARTVDLSIEDPETFSIYLHWLYCKTLPTVFTNLEEGTDSPEYLLLCKCYVLGNTIMDNEFRRAVLYALVDAKPHDEIGYPGSRGINIIYAGTIDGVPARRLLVDMWVDEAGMDWVDYIDNSLPHEFVADLARALLVNKCVHSKDTRPWPERITEYFEEQGRSRSFDSVLG